MPILFFSKPEARGSMSVFVFALAVDGDAEEAAESHRLRGEGPEFLVQRACTQGKYGLPSHQMVPNHPGGWFRGERLHQQLLPIVPVSTV